VNIITTHFDVLAGMDEVKVDKQYFDIEIDENDTIISDYKIKSGVSKKHLALKLLKKKGFDASIIADAEYLYEKLQGFDTKKKNVKEEIETETETEGVVIKDIVIEDSVEDVIIDKEEKDKNIILEDIVIDTKTISSLNH
jgi:DNA mismatch repair ATPase MutS